MTRVILTGIDGTAFQHPADRDATENLKRLFGFDRLVAKFLELRYERLMYVYNIGSSVRVGERQFPRLNAMLREASAVLDISEPELYVTQSPLVNAFTFGHTTPYVMIFTGLIDLLSDDELYAVIGHELGHIKCGHVLYNTMTGMIRDVISIAGQLTLGVGRLIGATIEATLMEWRRRAELSADRAALLATQDASVVISGLTKLAGGTRRFANELSTEAFLDQARRYRAEGETDDMMTILYRSLAEFMQGNHPFAVERVHEVDAWFGGEEYQTILKGEYPRAVKKVQIKVNKVG
ncbi:MAG: M48 family metallopeptidase [Anaerolineales bacterium]|nr:M48 family metallopeptidase [Anaerolineales bacterium]